MQIETNSVKNKTINRAILSDNMVGSMLVNHTEENNLTFQHDEYIFKEGDPTDFIYLIKSGRVKIGRQTETGEIMINTILGEGCLFGEMALSGNVERLNFAQAVFDNTTVTAIDITEMFDAIKTNPVLGSKVFELISQKIQKMERRIEALLFKDARSRIIDFLKEMATEHGQKVGYETMIKNHFTHKDIANITGTSRQTVTTTLNSLKEKNIINFDRRRILIRDMDLLV